MATGLIDAFGIGAPEVLDETAPAVQAYVDNKAGGGVTVIKQPPAATNDFLDAFAASIKAAEARKAVA